MHLVCPASGELCINDGQTGNHLIRCRPDQTFASFTGVPRFLTIERLDTRRSDVRQLVGPRVWRGRSAARAEPRKRKRKQRHHLEDIVDVLGQSSCSSDENIKGSPVPYAPLRSCLSAGRYQSEYNMAAYPQTMPQSAYRRAIPPPTTMSPPFPTYQAPAGRPQAGTAMPPVSAPMSNRAGARPPQAFYNNPVPQPGSIPAPSMKGTLRPGERIRVGSDTVIIEKYLSEG